MMSPKAKEDHDQRTITMADAAPLSPSTFLSPSITADLDNHIDAIEELLLSGVDDDGKAISGAPSSPSTAALFLLKSPSKDNNNASSATTSRSEVKTLSTYNCGNAVHMEVQENAKLPTFNLPVDRSNASWQLPAPRGRRSMGAKRSRSTGSGRRSRSSSIGSGDITGVGANTNTNAIAPYHPASPIPKLAHHTGTSEEHHGPMESATSLAIDEIMRLNENDINLSEMFLDGHDRSSAALAYCNSANGGGIPKLPDASTLGDAPQNNAAGGGIATVKHPNKRTFASGIGPRHQTTTRSLPYNRSKPLPIPTLKKPSPPRIAGANTIPASAIATAAAIATRASPTAGIMGGIPLPPGGMSKQTAAALSVQPTAKVGTVVSGTAKVGAAIPSTKIVVPPPKAPMSGQPPHLITQPRTAPIPATAAGKGPTPTVARKPGIPPAAAGIARSSGPSVPSTTGVGGAIKRPLPAHQYPPGHPNTAQAQAQARARQLAAHSKAKASIAHAAAQRSKFGFGGDHKVPSVPAPPPNVKGYPPARARAPLPSTAPVGSIKPAIATHNPLTKAPTTTSLNTYVPSPNALAKDVNSTIAYERKKQRAKNARVELNKSIEDLAVAIDLAGSQSKERFNYVTTIAFPGMNGEHMKSNGRPPAGPPQHPLARLMDETIQQASSAKKWDRPAFVGLSATIIHSLNAQCEGLMREVAQLRKMARQKDMNADATVSSLAAMTCVSMTGGSLIKANNGIHAKQQNGDSSLPSHTAKKQKTGTYNKKVSATTMLFSPSATVMQEQMRCIAIHNTMNASSLLKNIASFLDPKALCKCLRVAKRWRAHNVFQNSDLWLNICIKRFGVSAVRKWQDHEDECTRKKTKGSLTNLNLYRKMSEKNIKPYCPKEGTLFLGGSSLDGLVSCWVSLLDRSNGETSRSVMQQKVDQSSGTPQNYYGPLPVVELRLLVQNTGYSQGSIIIPDQQFSVDASTRRKGEKMLEVGGDDRFKRQVMHIEGKRSLSVDNSGKQLADSPQQKHHQQHQSPSLSHEMCHLNLYESAVISVHLHARGCSTTAKFCNRSKKIQLLVSIDGTTRPLSIPFHSMNEHQLKQMVH